MARTKSSVTTSIIKTKKGKLKSNTNINGIKSSNGTVTTVGNPKGKHKTRSSKAKILKLKSSLSSSYGNVNADAKLAKQTTSITQTKTKKTNSITTDKTEPLKKRKRNLPALTKPVACEICGNLFRTHQNLREHVIFHHTEDGKLLYEQKKLKKKLCYSQNRKRPYLQRQALETRRRRELLAAQKGRQFKYGPESLCEEIQMPPVVVVDEKVKLETYMEDNLDLKHQIKQEFKTE